MRHKNLAIIRTSVLCLATAITTAAIMTSPAMARNAKCLIQSSGTTEFSGTCDFITEKNGSFALSATKSSMHFIQNIDMVSVTVISPGQADVRGLTKAGINSRWGSAKRSRKDRACWLGTDFKICAW